MKLPDLCNNCLAMQLQNMTVRDLISSPVFDSIDGKMVLLFHLKEHNGCYSCFEEAKNHGKSFARSNGISVDAVDKFCRSL